MVIVVQLVRTPGCGPGGRRFESGLSPIKKPPIRRLFLMYFSQISFSVGKQKIYMMF
jgi:hypothetical protein